MKNAKNLCQAIPIFKLRARTINQAIETIIFTNATDLIAVSKVALDDYLQFVPFRGSRYVLYNFIPHKFSDASLRSDYETRESLPVRCVAVGGLKTVKNYHYLLDSFSLLPKGLFTLDVIGDGALRDDKILISEIRSEIEADLIQ